MSYKPGMIRLFFLAILVFKTSAFGSSDFEVKPLGHRNYWVKTASGKTPTFGSHSGAIKLKDGLLVIDAHLHKDNEKAVAEKLELMTKQKVLNVILSHAHEDHAGGISHHNEKGGSVWAHEAALPKAKTFGTAKAITKTLQGKLASEGIELILVGPAHSDGDVAVYDKNDKVLYTGDMFVNGYIGYLGEGNFTEWIAALNKLLKLELVSIVPGHGPVATSKELQSFRDYLQDFVQSAKRHFEKQGSPNGYTLPEKYKDWGAQFYLEKNIKRAFELWQKGKL